MPGVEPEGLRLGARHARTWVQEPSLTHWCLRAAPVLAPGCPSSHGTGTPTVRQSEAVSTPSPCTVDTAQQVHVREARGGQVMLFSVIESLITQPGFCPTFLYP